MADEVMQEDARSLDLSFVHRGKVLRVRVPAQATLMEVGQQLVSLSGVASHTLRLLLPRAPALLPFSPPHSALLISQSGIFEGQVVRMMGALPGEIEAVSQEVGNANERTIIGFSEEEMRAKRWRSARAGVSKGLPQGKYIFCDFRTLELPGVELNPSAVKAREIMQKLASDPGIIAIMNKHRWRVGVMTEMAPIGYVGISPECILGYNKNQGEEISLRLRTDDLKGFRKYESIKLTLLHELAHMVHSKHDANFHALNKQLKEESMSLDWTKSGGHSLGGFKFSSEEEDEEPTDVGGVFTSGGQKLGGSKEYNELGAHTAAALAAVLRLSSNSDRVQDNNVNTQELDIIAEENGSGSQTEFDVATKQEPNPDDCNAKSEPDEASSMVVDEILTEPYFRSVKSVQHPMTGSYLDINNARDILTDTNFDKKGTGIMTSLMLVEHQLDSSPENLRERFRKDIAEPAGEDSSLKLMQDNMETVCQRLQVAIVQLKEEASSPSDAAATIQSLFKILRNLKEHPHDDKFKRLRKGQIRHFCHVTSTKTKFLCVHTNMFCCPILIQANAVFQDRIARFKGAMEVLHAVGFSDGPCNGSEAADYLILKRHDPVLLWLAQSTLEACIA